QLMVPTIDIAMRHRRDLGLAEFGQDVGRDLLLIDALRRGALARHIVRLEALGEPRDRGCRPDLFALAHRVAAAVDHALEALGFPARLRRIPRAESPNGVAALLAVALAAVGEREGLRPGRCNADAKSLHGTVEHDAVVPLGLKALDFEVGEAHGAGSPS